MSWQRCCTGDRVNDVMRGLLRPPSFVICFLKETSNSSFHYINRLLLPSQKHPNTTKIFNNIAQHPDYRDPITFNDQQYQHEVHRTLQSRISISLPLQRISNSRTTRRPCRHPSEGLWYQSRGNAYATG